MPTTRKKVINTVYKDEDDSEAENAVGDFSDSGSEAEIPEHSSSEDDVEAEDSAEEFDAKSKKKLPPAKRVRKPKFAKEFVSKINRQSQTRRSSALEDEEIAPVLFSVKDLTDQDKLLPSVLNLSESDSSEDESPKASTKKKPSPPVPAAPTPSRFVLSDDSDSETEINTEYKDVFAQNVQEDSEEIAKKTFLELEKHKTTIEETKASILNYTGGKVEHGRESDVKDLLALGEEVLSPIQSTPLKKERKNKKAKDDSDSEMEDWEEVKDAKLIPQQGIQLIVDFPDAGCRKTKKLDVEMMMKRKINRVKKEYQVYMHKVHVLCWLGHGNYVSRVLNDQDVLAAALSLVPSKECYPGARVDMKYAEQITTWFKDKLTLKQDKNEEKFRPKAPPLKNILLSQIKSRVVTSKKYMVFIFVSMLRALGLQCRVMFNFVTLPIKPPSSELCSLSTKLKDARKVTDEKEPPKTYKKSQYKSKKKIASSKLKSNEKISQMDGTYDSSSESDMDNIMQLDGNDDEPTSRTRRTRTNKNSKTSTIETNEDVPPPKKARKSLIPKIKETVSEKDEAVKRQLSCRKIPERSEKKSAETKSTKNNTKELGKEKKETILKSEMNGETEKDDTTKRKRACRKSPVRSDKKSSDTKCTKNNTKESENKKKSTEQTSKVEKMDVDLSETKRVPSLRKTRTNIAVISEKQSAESTDTKSNTKESQGEKKNTEQMAQLENMDVEKPEIKNVPALRKTRNNSKSTRAIKSKAETTETKALEPPKITITDVKNETSSSKYFNSDKPSTSKSLSLRKRSSTANPPTLETTEKVDEKPTLSKTRTKSAPGTSLETSRYFKSEDKSVEKKRTRSPRLTKKEIVEEDKQRVSHRDILAKNKAKSNNDITSDLVKIIKKRVNEAKEDSKKGIVKGKVKQESDEDSDHLPEETPRRCKSDSDEDFKPTKISPRPSTSRVAGLKKETKKIDRRVLSSEEHEVPKNKCDVWCEIFVEELEQWIAVDVIKGKVHCTNDIYSHCTHPVCYIVGWDNNNYLKDLTRRYVPQWNTVTRKQRAEPAWWEHAIKPWLGPKTAKDREEDEQLNRMQLEAPLPKSIAEYKNHPLYALKRHLLKFEAIYPPDAATLGFVRGEPVYARECVYVCRSRDTWLKEAKVVKLGEQPYKVVKARPKWDRLSNKLITDKPLEVFGPWQVQDYEPPTAEDGVVPRNAYGNVELFKDCMLPKGTVHIKLPGLNRVAKKLNIDCAPAMTGFDFNGGWSHPVYDGFVVCEEFKEIITDAWVKDQEDQERREREKIETRVYGNWRRLIKGLLIRERLKLKYGFEDPALVKDKDKKKKGPRLLVKK